jgi:hypothetical protein
MMLALSATAPASADAQMSYLDNGVIRVGVDLGKGGTITYLSRSIAVAQLGAVNVVNSTDLGREVQQSYYSGPDGYGNPAPPNPPDWSWNPIGAGDGYGNPATVVEHSNDGKTIYTKTIPLQWVLNDVACECFIEQWIRLNGNAVQVHNRLTNNRSDHTQYHSYGQEAPAAYTNGTFWRLFTYNGAAPYTDAPLTQLPLAPVATSRQCRTKSSTGTSSTSTTTRSFSGPLTRSGPTPWPTGRTTGPIIGSLATGSTSS